MSIKDKNQVFVGWYVLIEMFVTTAATVVAILIMYVQAGAATGTNVPHCLMKCLGVSPPEVNTKRLITVLNSLTVLERKMSHF